MTRRKHRRFTPEQKFEIVMEGLKGKRTVTDVCRDHRIRTALFYTWRDQVLSGALSRLSGAELEDPEAVSLRKKVAALERVLGQKSLELEVANQRPDALGLSNCCLTI